MKRKEVIENEGEEESIEIERLPLHFVQRKL
jgi:hypothetical protein